MKRPFKLNIFLYEEDELTNDVEEFTSIAVIDLDRIESVFRTLTGKTCIEMMSGSEFNTSDYSVEEMLSLIK
jgi:hypothetical protein